MRGLSLSRMIWPAAALALAVLAVLAVLDRLGENARAAARQALLVRAALLEQTALAPGSMLPCVDGTSGDTVDNACEKRVFASAQSTAAAVAYMAARIDLLDEAAALVRRGDKRVLSALASTRRAVALDRYGIAAHVLAERDGCTATKCAVFAALDNTDVLKSNLRAQTFDQYVSRYAADWRAPTSANEARAESTPAGTPTLGKPVPSRWHFPSSNSIPAVSIMNPEPKLPKAVAEQLNRDTAKKMAIERRKEGKDTKKGTPAAVKKSSHKKEATKKPQEPGAPLQLTH